MLIPAHKSMMIKREIGADLLIFRLAIELGVGACPGFFLHKMPFTRAHLQHLPGDQGGQEGGLRRVGREAGVAGL